MARQSNKTKLKKMASMIENMHFSTLEEMEGLIYVLEAARMKVDQLQMRFFSTESKLKRRKS